MENTNIRIDLFGRRLLTASPVEMTAQNVALILNAVLPLHLKNSEEIRYLNNYYRGDQPILYREKEIRSDIKNLLVENRAFEFIAFKCGYEFSHPIIYTNAGQEDIAPVDILNTYARIDGKDAKDLELAEWFYKCGTAYRICLPSKNQSVDEAPYYTDVLDPRRTFVVYSNEVGKKALLAGTYAIKQTLSKTGQPKEQWVFGIYTDTEYFEWFIDGFSERTTSIQGVDFTKITPTVTKHPLGMIPIIEYPLNESRIGYIELCYHLFNAINNIGSNRVDGIEQFVQALLVFINCQLPEDEEGNKVIPKSGDAIDVKGTPGLNADIKYLVAQLDQSQAQITKEDLLNAAYEIAGIPSRNDRGGGGDTGQAVVLRDGWGAAEARAKTTEKLFKKSEMEYLKIVLRICRDMAKEEIGNLTLRDISISFTRNRSDSMQTKATTLKMLLDCGVHPEDSYETVELFSDPVATYRKSKDWISTDPESGTQKVKNISTMLTDGYIDEPWAIANNPLIAEADKKALLSRVELAEQQRADVLIPLE